MTPSEVSWNPAMTFSTRWQRAIPTVLAPLLLAAGCGTTQESAPTGPSLGVPDWAGDAIWYQVFVERFRNGDPSNDPTAHDIIGFTADSAPAGWGTTAWGHDWYQRDTWARSSNKDFYTAAQFRRYGGDLKGLIDKLDYLQQ